MSEIIQTLSKVKNYNSQKMSEIELLPCPFCGGKAEVRATKRLVFNGKYMGTLVNFILDWHDNEKDQRYIVEQIRMIDNEIEMIERQIDNEKQLKKWYLEKMMANDYP